MSLNLLDSSRCKHFQMLLDYFVQRYGKELGIQNYTEWLEANNYNDHTPMIKQSGLKSLFNMLENRTHKHKDNPLEKKKRELLAKFKKEALSKDLATGELYRFKKRIEGNMADADLVDRFRQLGETTPPNDPSAEELRALKKNYTIATSYAPSSIQSRGAKMIVARLTENLISEGKATRKQIEEFL